jgi:hypothetical protein
VTWQQIVLIVYGVGAVIDLYDSLARRSSRRPPALLVLWFAASWPLTILLSMYRKVTR